MLLDYPLEVIHCVLQRTLCQMALLVSLWEGEDGGGSEEGRRREDVQEGI